MIFGGLGGCGGTGGWGAIPLSMSPGRPGVPVRRIDSGRAIFDAPFNGSRGVESPGDSRVQLAVLSAYILQWMPGICGGGRAAGHGVPGAASSVFAVDVPSCG
jgi:hypothetical protein